MRCASDGFALALAFALCVAPTVSSAQDACATCHRALGDPRLRGPVDALATSAHRGDDIGCVGCHGGRRGEPTTRAHDAAAGFVARPSSDAVAERCGACHADARFVRRHGAALPVDQLALYRQDVHGRALARGVADAATCVSCHGAHDVRPSHDPTARTHPSRIAELCGHCHTPHARPDGTRSEPVADWTRGAHGESFTRDDAAGAPTCVGCHGRHGELAERGGPASACARCHAEEAALFAQSPHAGAWQRLGFGGCVACHGSHDVPAASDVLLGTGARSSCTRCHAQGQRAWDRAAALAARRDDVHARASRALRLVRDAREQGIDPPGAGVAVEQMRDAEARLRVASHALDEATFDDAARAVLAPASRAESITRRAMTRHRDERRAWLRALPLLGLLLTLLLVRIRRLDREAPP